MCFRNLVLPSARSEFHAYCETYGQPFTADARCWIDQLVVEAACPGIVSSSVSVGGLIERVLAITARNQHPAWEYSRQRFEEAGFLERLRMFLITLSTCQPPWELLTVSREFSGLDGAVVFEFEAYYQICRHERQVTFIRFDVYGPGVPR